MLTGTTIKRLTAISEITKTGKKINGLFRLMENPVIWKQAYSNIYANNGAITKGIDNVTLDGFSEERINQIIEQLKNGAYHFKPVRRTYIPKKNGKQRALGIPNGNDKLVQEVMRIILNQIYEPIFSNLSHGFRENRSCHTALTQVKQTWTGAKWMIEMDIEGFFDNIDHEVMMTILRKKIDDKRFLALIAEVLKAGYMEDWKFNGTYSGTPQGGIISPILANIYLNELDSYVEELMKEFNLGDKRRINPDYQLVHGRIEGLRKKYRKIKDTATAEELAEISRQIRVLSEERKKIPFGDQSDPNYKRLRYSRYADDFILGVIGSKADAVRVSENIRGFITEKLNLQIAEDKFAIRHASDGVNYLGFRVISYSGKRCLRLKNSGTYTVQRTTKERIQLIIPDEKLVAFACKNGYGDLYRHIPASRPMLTCNDDSSIIEAYNAELRGIVNYYCIGNSPARKLEPLVSLARTSCAMTLAHRHRSTTSKIISEMRQPNGEWIRTVHGANKDYKFRLYRLKTDMKKCSPLNYQEDIIGNMPTAFIYGKTDVIQRLEANTCELCGSHEKVEVHHVRKLKDLQGKEYWEQVMLAKRRKTLCLCSKCHHKLHNGTLN